MSEIYRGTVDPLEARYFNVGCDMCFTWRLHRRWTGGKGSLYCFKCFPRLRKRFEGALSLAGPSPFGSLSIATTGQLSEAADA